MQLKATHIKQALHQELLRILRYWQQNTVDEAYGGFVGKIDCKNQVVPMATKGIILNTRILWSFAAAAQYLNTTEYDEVCHRAYQYLCRYFFDKEHGGVIWEVDFEGNPVNSRKQVYAQAFAIYSLAEYYSYCQAEEAKQQALAIFQLLEDKAKDPFKGGYLEAFDRDWSPLEDMRLSPKDLNAAKTMNTHLHVVEAYTRLLQVTGDEEVRAALRQLTALYNQRFLAREGYFHLFFDEDWHLQSQVSSYGHDIESAWLLLDAAIVVGDEEQTRLCEHNIATIADRMLAEAIDHDGAVLYEKDLCTGEIDQDRHWWPQVECMVGLAYQHMLSGDARYLQSIEGIWQYTTKNLLDKYAGEWYFRVDQNGKPYAEDLVSMWKAPYHTTRACMVINEVL